MTKIIVFLKFLLLLTISTTEAQTNISGRIVDNKTKEPIDLIQVCVKNKKIGTYTNINGTYSLDNISINDTLVLNHISYITKQIPVNLINKTITLNRKSIEIKEFTVTGDIQKYYTIIPKKKKFNSTFRGRRGDQISTLICSKKFKGSYIKDIIIQTKKIKVNNYIIRVHLYENNEGQPSNEISYENKIHILKKGSRKTTINILENKIIFPEKGIFVAIEWIGLKSNKKGTILQNNKKTPRILINETNKRTPTYIKYWGIPWIPLDIPIYKTGYKLLIGITVIR